MPNSPSGHVQLRWQNPQFRRWFELVAEKRMLVDYDGRGHGLSDRDVTDYTLQARMLDLEAVLDRLGLERAALIGMANSGPVAIAYAARHPERVSHLVLWQAWARGADYYESPQIRTLTLLMERDWNMYLENFAHVSFGWSEGEFSHQYAHFLRECVTQEAALATTRACSEFDTAPLLAQVECPTLVMHVREAAYPTVDTARHLAASIPNARLALLEGTDVGLVGDLEERAAIIDEFLGLETATGPTLPADESLRSGTAIILCLDIADSVALTEQLGDAAFRTKAGELDASLRAAVREVGGTPVEGKVLGDGVMAVFSSARGAIDCALRCRTVGDDAGLPLHLGIHAGDILREGTTVYGGAVNLASASPTPPRPARFWCRTRCAASPAPPRASRSRTAATLRRQGERLMEPCIQYVKTSDGVRVAAQLVVTSSAREHGRSTAPTAY